MLRLPVDDCRNRRELGELSGPPAALAPDDDVVTLLVWVRPELEGLDDPLLADAGRELLELKLVEVLARLRLVPVNQLDRDLYDLPPGPREDLAEGDPRSIRRRAGLGLLGELRRREASDLRHGRPRS